MITLDVPNRVLHPDVSEDELAKRRESLTAFENPYDRGYSKMYVDHVNQATDGADLDFLVGNSGTPEMRESH